MLEEPYQLVRVNTRIKLFDTGLAETMAEFGLGVIAEIFFQLLPEAPVIADFLTGGANRNQAAKDFHFFECALQLVVAPLRCV